MGNYIGETIGDDEGKYIGCFLIGTTKQTHCNCLFCLLSANHPFNPLCNLFY